jgi:hypothetical protein
MEEIEVRLTADTDDLERNLRSLADISELPLEVRESLIDAFSSGSQSLSFDCESASTGGAGNLRICIKLSDFMRGFVAALRARDFNRVVVDESHESQRIAIAP